MKELDSRYPINLLENITRKLVRQVLFHIYFFIIFNNLLIKFYDTGRFKETVQVK